MYGELCPYTPAPWMEKLKNIPTVKVNLAMIPTPIHRWNLPGVTQNMQVYIKRDDMTRAALTGNKTRKLEYIFGHILQNGYKNVITTGRTLSNLCRATAVVGARLGVKCHLLQRSYSKNLTNGNIFLSRMCGANIYLIQEDCREERFIKPRCDALAKEIFQTTGEETYYSLISDGLDTSAVFGYLDAWNEMIGQGVLEKIDDVVVVAGSGGTAAGLAIGNYLTGSKVKVHAITISRSSKNLQSRINDSFKMFGLGNIKSEDVVDIIEGYIGAGYGASTDEDHKLSKAITSATGVFCDPVYICKGAKGLIYELNSNPSRFKGERVLFIHTGGIFDLYDGRMFDMFSNENVHDWMDIEKSPLEFL